MKRRLIFEYDDDNRVVVEDEGAGDVVIWTEDFRDEKAWRPTGKPSLLTDAEIETLAAWRMAVRAGDTRMRSLARDMEEDD